MAALDLHHQLLEGGTQRHVRDAVRSHDLVGLEARLRRLHVRERRERHRGRARDGKVYGAGEGLRVTAALREARAELHRPRGRTSASTSSVLLLPLLSSSVSVRGTLSPAPRGLASPRSITW